MGNDKVERDDSEESVLDRPIVCTLTDEEKNHLRTIMDESDRFPQTCDCDGCGSLQSDQVPDEAWALSHSE